MKIIHNQVEVDYQQFGNSFLLASTIDKHNYKMK